MPDAMSHFFKLCGTSIDDHLDLVPLEPAYRVIDVTSDIDAMAELFESREPGAGAKLRTYIDSATQVYNLAIDGFLYTNFTNFIPYLSPGMLRLLPKLLASLSTSLKVKVNTQFRDTKLRQILSYPAVFLSSDPSHTPALYHLMSHTDLVQGVSYPRGGFTAFIKALISLIDDAVLHLGTPSAQSPPKAETLQVSRSAPSSSKPISRSAALISTTPKPNSYLLRCARSRRRAGRTNNPASVLCWFWQA
ncbi:Phytoene dehydrogenase and related proteins [Corynebacterium glutamicum]|nr:Phytoene dehydrogenase and related proteins [Corynebacterium glutamicum]